MSDAHEHSSEPAGGDHTENDGHDHAHDDVFNRLLGGRAEIIFAALCGLCLLTGWLGPKLNLIPGQIGFGFLLAAYFFGGYFALREALGKIFKGQFQIDFLMLVAASGAAFLGEWARRGVPALSVQYRPRSRELCHGPRPKRGGGSVRFNTGRCLSSARR